MSSVTTSDLENLQMEMTAYTDAITQLAFIMLTAFCIVFMQAGFAMLEAGGCRSKNSKSILYKNGIDLSVGVLIWWFWGYGFATADNKNTAIRNFESGHALSFLITVAFCTTAARNHVWQMGRRGAGHLRCCHGRTNGFACAGFVRRFP